MAKNRSFSVENTFKEPLTAKNNTSDTQMAAEGTKSVAGPSSKAPTPSKTSSVTNSDAPASSLGFRGKEKRDRKQCFLFTKTNEDDFIKESKQVGVSKNELINLILEERYGRLQ